MRAKPNPLPKEELSKRLEALELQWLAEGLALKLQPLESFKEIYGSVFDEHGRKELFDEITLWYVEKHGYAAMEWDGIIGRVPVQLRSVLYFVKVPFVQETTAIKFTDRFENLPEKIAETLTKEEFDVLGRSLTSATMSWQSIYTLNADNTFLKDRDRKLLRRGMLDIEAACSVLSASSDTQGAVFHAHAASEKFLKVAFRRAGSTIEVKEFGHRSNKLFKELISLAPRYTWLHQSVDRLQALAPNMEIRYDTTDTSLTDAVSAIHASLFLCGTLAVMWNFDNVRGSEDSRFRAGAFYKNGTHFKFYCKRIDKDSVTMTAFGRNKLAGSQMLDITMPASNSALYLEITDTLEEMRFRVQLIDQLRNPGKKVKPEEIGLERTNSAEGIYTTGIIRRKIGK